MACDLSTTQAAACESGIGKLDNPVSLLQLIAQLSCEIADAGGGGGGTPSAPLNSVQFNDAGAFGGDAAFTFNSATSTLSVTNITAPLSANTQVLFNDGGVIAGDAGITFNKANNYLTLAGGFIIGTAATIDNVGGGDGLRLSTGFTARWDILSTGHLIAVSDNALDIGASGATRPRNLFLAGGITTGATTLHSTTAALSDNSGAGAGTLGNAPTAGNPTKWIAIDDNGTPRYIPTWT